MIQKMRVNGTSAQENGLYFVLVREAYWLLFCFAINYVVGIYLISLA